MTCNVGGVERPIRIVVGIALLGIGAFAGLPPVGTGIALVVGTIALVTGAIGFCPVGDVPFSTPMRRIRSPCCARVVNGQATPAQPSAAMNSRLPISIVI